MSTGLRKLSGQRHVAKAGGRGDEEQVQRGT
jgi:hypothetical protein